MAKSTGMVVAQQFGDYRLIRLLGQGSFGSVYLEKHIRDKSLAAVKILQAQITDSEGLKEFITREPLAVHLDPAIVLSPEDAVCLSQAHDRPKELLVVQAAIAAYQQMGEKGIGDVNGPLDLPVLTDEVWCVAGLVGVVLTWTARLVTVAVIAG